MFLTGKSLPPIVGYGLTFGEPTNRRACGRRFRFSPGAFDSYLACYPESIFAVMDHDGHEESFASVKAGTMLIDSDATGLFVVILPSNTQTGRIAVSLVAGGHAAGMSASVTYKRRSITEAAHVSTVSLATVEEISITNNPAIKSTCAYVARPNDRLPRTIDQLLAEDLRLRECNLQHEQLGTLDKWKEQKAIERALLLAH